MAQQDEGIMALMGAGTAPVEQEPQINMREFRRQAYPVSKDAVREVAPEAYGEMQSMLSSEIAAEMSEMSLQEISQLADIVDYINENPEEYAQVRSSLISAGIIDEEDFPPEMDVEFFATMQVVLEEALAQKEQEAATMAQGPVGMMPPQGFAKGGIAEAAQLVASKGRRGDTMLAHITPAEAQLLRARGGSGTINPATGLPEFFLKKAFKAVKNVVKKVASSPIGRIALTVGLSMVMPPWAASALVTKAAGGSWKDALKSAAVSYLAGPTSPISSAVSKATPFLSGMNPAVAAGIRSGITSTGASLLTGSSLKEAVTAGVTSGLMTGVQAARAAPAAGSENMAPVRDMSTTEGAAPAANLQARPLTPTDAFGAATAPAAAGAAPSASQFGLGPDAYNLGAAPAPGAPPSGFGSVPAPSAAGQAPSVDPNVAPSFFDQAKGFYDRNISPSGIREAGELQAQQAGTAAVDKLVKINPNASDAVRAAEYTRAANAATPGVISQYAPVVGAGLGVTALAGGFDAKDPKESQFEKDMRKPIDVPPSLQKPIQNLPGVEYDESGNIIGSKPWDPSAGLGPVEVAAPGIMSLQTPAGSIPPPGAPTIMGQGAVSQPFNTSSMYGNLMRPSGYRAGGVANLAQGGYPRRIGQISGPGTETSDDIPAMLSDGEFVMTARAVRGAGNGSRRAGAKKMYAMMHQLEQNAARG
jgi:hypothetical protein